MEPIEFPAPQEHVQIDPDQLSQLYAQLGETGAEDVICRALEDLAGRLDLMVQQYKDKAFGTLRKNARAMVGISEQIGMGTLAQSAQHVIFAYDAGDTNALAATVARLLRVGEQSLIQVWDLQDLSV